MTYRKQTTSKLFYGKWPYKIECRVAGSYRIKREGVNATLKFCMTPDDLWQARYRPVNKDRLRSFAKDVDQFLDLEVQIRTESDVFNIYCKDPALHNKMVTALKQYIVEVVEPASNAELDFMMSNSHKKVMCNHYPHEKYHYRVYFKPGCDSDVKRRFESWIENYKDNILVAKGTKIWFYSGWRQGPFIYVTDQPTLTMVGLFMGNNIQKVEEFILRSNINTSLNQEQVCQVSA